MRGDSSQFSHCLLDWFDQIKRALPWRTDPSLYKTVVSEFMLQQTQVDTVLPYFQRWMERFPDFKSIAQAEESEVLKHWEGLGYYSRARNLHKLAKALAPLPAAEWPQSPAHWQALPGIGPYSAAAICSIAQNFPAPVIDGNVIRVLARLENDDTPLPSQEKARKRFLPLAEKLVSKSRPGDYNEALMELGATLCRKHKPACLLCPVKSFCRATVEGSPASLPRIERKPTRQTTRHRLFLREEAGILLFRHPLEARRLAGLYELPEIKDPGPASEPILVRTRGISSERVRECIHRLPRAHLLAQAALKDPSSNWIEPATIDTLALSAPHKRWLRELLKH
jgi:A/G-specific adenine glycosylase